METELVLSEEEEREMEEGEAAASLLDSPIFLKAIEKIRDQCAEGILTSEPSKPDVREHLYNLSRGLSAVTEQLAIMAAKAQSIAENAALQTNQDDDAVQDTPDLGADY
jgi:hypothetical protein